MAYRRVARRQKKSPVGVKNPFIIFNPHTKRPVVHSSRATPGSNYVRVVTIDPGVKNFAIRIARFEPDGNDGKGKVHTEVQWRTNFKHDAYDLHAKLQGEEKSEIGRETSHYINAMKFLDKHMEYIKWSHYIVMESQLVINYEATRIGQHTLTYLMACVKDQGFRPIIVELDSHTKTRMLGAPKKVDIKKWSPSHAIEVLHRRGDHSTAEVIERATKKDDHGDVVCYEIVWWKLLAANPDIPKPS